MKKALTLGIGIVLLALLGAACAKAAPTATPTATPRPAPTATATAAPAATPTATPRPAAPTPTPTPGIRRGGELVDVETSLPDTLDPASGTTPDLHMIVNIYDQLEGMDYTVYDFGTKYGLAEKFEIRDDGKTFVFTLRQGCKFHGGETLTADDVKFTYERIKDPATRSPWLGRVDIVNTIEAPDPRTVIMRLKAVNPAVREDWQVFGLLPRSWAQGKSVEFMQGNTNGTSSWKVKEFKFRETLRMEAFKDQCLGWVPYFDTLRIVPALEPLTRLALLQSGQAQIMHDLPIKLVPQAKSAGIKVSIRPIRAAAMLWIAVHMDTDPDTGQPNPWKDVRVRQAANYAVNKDEICAKIFDGTCTPLKTLIPVETAVGYVPPAQMLDYSYNPEKAKQLLKDAGYANGFSAGMHPPSGGETFVLAPEVNQAVAEQWKAVGIQGKYEPLQQTVWLQKFAAHQLGPISMTTWRPTTDAYSFLNFCCRLASGFAWYRDEDFDKRLNAAAAVIDPGERHKQFQVLVKEVWEKAVSIWLYEPPTIWAMQSDISWTPPLRDQGRFWFAYREAK